MGPVTSVAENQRHWFYLIVTNLYLSVDSDTCLLTATLDRVAPEQ